MAGEGRGHRPESSIRRCALRGRRSRPSTSCRPVGRETAGHVTDIDMSRDGKVGRWLSSSCPSCVMFLLNSLQTGILQGVGLGPQTRGRILPGVMGQESCRAVVAGNTRLCGGGALGLSTPEEGNLLPHGPRGMAEVVHEAVAIHLSATWAAHLIPPWPTLPSTPCKMLVCNQLNPNSLQQEFCKEFRDSRKPCGFAPCPSGSS